MHKELYVKCPKCSSEIKFNYYIKKFKCSKCNSVLELNDLNSQKNFSKNAFLKELQETLKGKIIPKCFKKINEDDLKLIYVPLIIYNAKFIIDDDNKYSLYEINNMALTEFTDFDDLTLKSLFPIDIDSNIDNQDFEIDDYLILKFNKEKEKMLDLIESRVKEDLKYNLKEHPNAKRTPLGSGKTYLHGKTDNSTGSISFNLDDIDLSKEKIIDMPIEETDYEILTNEEIENYIKELEENNDNE